MPGGPSKPRTGARQIGPVAAATPGETMTPGRRATPAVAPRSGRHTLARSSQAMAAMTGRSLVRQTPIMAAAVAGCVLAAAGAAPPTPTPTAAPRALSLGISGPGAQAGAELTLGGGYLDPGGTERRWRLVLDAPPTVRQPARAGPAPRAGRVLVIAYPPAPSPAPASPMVSALVPPGRTGSLFPLDPLERAALGEMERARSYGGPDNWSAPAFMVSIPVVVDMIRDAVRSRRARRLPEGARVGGGRRLRLLALEASGRAPEAVTVIPLVLGWVAATAGGPCDAGGSCEVDALPDAGFTALVIGDGAAVVDVPATAAVVVARLRPLGVLRLLPSAGAHDLAVRVTDAVTRLAVPIHAALNQSRGEWIRPGAGGALVLAAQGGYVGEGRPPPAPPARQAGALPRGGTAVVTLPVP